MIMMILSSIHVYHNQIIHNFNCPASVHTLQLGYTHSSLGHLNCDPFRPLLDPLDGHIALGCLPLHSEHTC